MHKDWYFRTFLFWNMSKKVFLIGWKIFQNQDIPEPSNKRFFQRTSTIRNHITHTKRKLCHSRIDQDCLQEKIKQWKLSEKSSNIFFRLKIVLDIEEHDDIRLGKMETTPFLFVYQNRWQKRLFFPIW